MMNPSELAVRPETAIIHPPIPYNGQIPKLKDDTLITIQGSVSPNVQRFAINLNTSALPNCDIALHVNPRFEGTFAIVRNSYRQGQWGPEERDGPTFPLMPGAPFNFSILVTNECYKIAFNSNHFCEYPHRIRKDLVSFISISGDINIFSIRVKRNKQPPQMGMAPFMPQAVPPPPPYSPYASQGMAPGMTLGMMSAVGEMAYPAVPPEMPYSAPLPQGMYPGCMIFISGKVKKSPDKFIVDLLFLGGIAFHFNPRFNGTVIVCNTMHGDTWGLEERINTFPFKAQEKFDVIILCEEDKFKVAVSGRHLLEYKHRIPFGQVSKFSIHGDITLTDVHVQ